MNFFYEHLIARKRGSAAFVILLFCLLAFVISRACVYAAMLGYIPDSLTVNVRGVHIHHFAWGIMVASVAGFINFVLPYHLLPKWRLKLAAVYGWGLGWTFDEFGMWLHLRDDYLIRQSYDAMIILGAILINVVYFSRIWRLLFRTARAIIVKK